MNSKEKYIRLITEEKFLQKIPVFANPVWLDEVAEHWDACITEDKGKITGVLPYCTKGNFLTKRIYLPYLSFYQSPVLFEDDLSKEQKNSIIRDLFQQLPKTVRSYFKLLPEYTDADLSTLGYSKQEYPTYLIPTGQDIQPTHHHQRNIQKGIKQHFTTETSKDLKRSYTVIASTFERQDIKPKLSEAEFIKIARLASKHRMGNVVDCMDTDKNLLATAFVAEDQMTMYYLLSGYDTAFKNSGAMTFLLHHLVEEAGKRNLDFNFCGSAKKSIADFFEGFGAQKTPIAIWQKNRI